jgi:hypothetical protein
LHGRCASCSDRENTTPPPTARKPAPRCVLTVEYVCVCMYMHVHVHILHQTEPILRTAHPVICCMTSWYTRVRGTYVRRLLCCGPSQRFPRIHFPSTYGCYLPASVSAPSRLPNSPFPSVAVDAAVEDPRLECCLRQQPSQRFTPPRPHPKDIQLGFNWGSTVDVGTEGRHALMAS